MKLESGKLMFLWEICPGDCGVQGGPYEVCVLDRCHGRLLCIDSKAQGVEETRTLLVADNLREGMTIEEPVVQMETITIPICRRWAVTTKQLCKDSRWSDG